MVRHVSEKGFPAGIVSDGKPRVVWLSGTREFRHSFGGMKCRVPMLVCRIVKPVGEGGVRGQKSRGSRVRDDSRGGFRKDVMHGDGVAEDFPEVGLAQARSGSEGRECGGGIEREGVGEAVLDDEFGTDESRGLVADGHDLLARPQKEIAQLETVVDDGLTGRGDFRGGVGREEVFGTVEAE